MVATAVEHRTACSARVLKVAAWPKIIMMLRNVIISKRAAVAPYASKGVREPTRQHRSDFASELPLGDLRLPMIVAEQLYTTSVMTGDKQIT